LSTRSACRRRWFRQWRADWRNTRREWLLQTTQGRRVDVTL